MDLNAEHTGVQLADVFVGTSGPSLTDDRNLETITLSIGTGGTPSPSRVFNSIIPNHDPVAALGIEAGGRPANQEEVCIPAQPIRKQTVLEEPAQPMTRLTVVGIRNPAKDGENYHASTAGNNPGQSSATPSVRQWRI